MARSLKKRSVIYDSVDEELQLQTSVRSDEGGGGGSDPAGPPGSAPGGGKYLMYDHVQESPC